MTCIVGIAQDGIVAIGGDSAGVDTARLSMSVRSDRKVFRNGPFVMGFTTSFRMGQILAYAFKPPEAAPEEADLFGFMVTHFVDAVREVLKAGGYAKRENDVESGGAFLVGYRGRLFQIQSDYQVAEQAQGYDAVGCGCDLALGSLFATSEQAGAALESAEARIVTALAAAAQFSAGVSGPFHILATDPAAPTNVVRLSS